MNKENKTSDKQQNGNDFIADVMRSIYNEMQIDTEFISKSDRHTNEFKEGYKEALRNLAVIIKNEEGVDVR